MPKEKKPKYYLKADWQGKFSKVSEEQFSQAEHNAGFRSKFPGSPATGGWHDR